MDRQVRIGNRLVFEKIQQYRIRKHRETLSLIKNRGALLNQTGCNQEIPKSHRYSSDGKSEKNLEIERQNIKIFNRIAQIIKQRPKINQNISLSSQSFKQTQLKIKKHQQKIKTQNQFLQKRLLQQKPTIKNRQFYKDRIKNLRYLKFIGKYPYQKMSKDSNFHTKSSTNIPSSSRISAQFLMENQQILHRKKLQDYYVQISRISNHSFLFTIEQYRCSKRIYKMSMKKEIYEDQFIKCGYNFQKMISRVRLNNQNQILFDYIHDD